MEETNMEEERGGITFGKILSYIWKYIIWVLGASVIVALIVGLVTMFAIGPSKDKYSISFMIEYPNYDSETGKMYYPDGTLFRYETIVYADTLDEVVQAHPELENINVKKMANNNSIEIKEKTREIKNGTSATEQPLGIYTVSVTGNYFKNSKQADEFLHAVSDYTVDKINEMVAERSYTANLINYNAVSTFEQQISILENQQSFLLKQYDAFTEKYGNNVFGEKTLNDCRAELANIFNGDVRLSVMKKDLENNRYLHNQTVEEVLTTIRSLEREKKVNTAAVEALTEKVEHFMSGATSGDLSTSEGLNAYHSQIATYLDRNVKIDNEVEELYESIGYVYSESTGEYVEPAGGAQPIDETKFKSDLTSLYNLIVEQTTICKNVITKLYQENTAFKYEQNTAVYEDGASTILYALLGFVVAFVVASVVVCIVGTQRDKKAAAANNGQPQAQEAQPQETEELHLEAAVAEDKEEKKEKNKKDE